MEDFGGSLDLMPPQETTCRRQFCAAVEAQLSSCLCMPSLAFACLPSWAPQKFEATTVIPFQKMKGASAQPRL
jgi:hypothetical protein